MSMITSMLAEMSIVEQLVFALTPVVVVIGVYFLFKVGALGPEPTVEPTNHA